MTETINKYEEIMNRLKSEGKVTILDSDDDYNAMEEMNISTEKNKREYQIKDFNTQIAAANVILK